MKHSSFDATISALNAETLALSVGMSALDVETSAFGVATSALDVEMSALGAVTSALVRSYRRYRRRVFGDQHARSTIKWI